MSVSYDYTTFTEVDPNNRIAFTSSAITLTAVPRNEDVYLYYDSGADYWGDFTFNFDASISSTGVAPGSLFHAWGLSNTVNDRTGWAAGLLVMLYYSGTAYNVQLAEIGGTSDSYNISANTTYYFTVSRVGTTLALYVYTDSNRTTLASVLSRTVATTTYRYLYAMANYNDNSASIPCSGTIGNLAYVPITLTLPGWKYRKSITLSRASGAVTEYQMKLLVGESSGAAGEDVDCGQHCKTDFSDLRFTGTDGIPLSYWIESTSGTTPNQLATIWIKFPSIGTGATTFYMYYGNANAPSLSNGVATFPFFDDFSAAFAKWTGNTGNYQVSSGTLQRKYFDNAIPKILKSATLFNPNSYALRWRGKSTPTTDGLDPVGWYYSDTRWCAIRTNVFNGVGDRAYDWSIIADAGAGQSGGDGTMSVDTYYIYDLLKADTTHYRGYIDGTQIGSDEVCTNQDSNHYVAFSAYDNDNTTWRYFTDWVLVRKFTATEPAWGTWGVQERTHTPLPSFLG